MLLNVIYILRSSCCSQHFLYINTSYYIARGNVYRIMSVCVLHSWIGTAIQKSSHNVRLISLSIKGAVKKSSKRKKIEITTQRVEACLVKHLTDLRGIRQESSFLQDWLVQNLISCNTFRGITVLTCRIKSILLNNIPVNRACLYYYTYLLLLYYYIYIFCRAWNYNTDVMPLMLCVGQDGA